MTYDNCVNDIISYASVEFPLIYFHLFNNQIINCYVQKK